jgi:hypothetical protein
MFLSPGFFNFSWRLRASVTVARDRAPQLRNRMVEKLAMGKEDKANLALQTEAIGALAIAIAHRRIMGWPDHVAGLLAAGTYFDCLAPRVEQEKRVLANEPNMRRLARHEILQIYEVSEAPPW